MASFGAIISDEAETTEHDLRQQDAPPMMRSLDEVLPMPEDVRDLAVVSRELPDGKGRFEALHNVKLSYSMLSGCIENTNSLGGTTRYEGTFLNRDPHSENPTPCGRGVRSNADGSVYAGQWKDGFPHGDGEWRAPEPSCESYVGDWKRGKKHGFGVQRYANGDVYEGDWSEGKHQDRGKYTYASGDIFQGFFERGNKSQGTFYFKDGRTSVRKWVNGTLVTCQDYDSRRAQYRPTLHRFQAHDPERNRFQGPLGQAAFGVITPRGLRLN
eukprot:TRINITY_DN58355_c0_g1_i1.p1 TRINITY_DN58355_c0_g1~~TRINITY_DN58355_c0_g1_i1.p1  ORF type:complete len:308 (+),score=30.83 TRINITY_DN58355_c0_g1_i1:117-926(+)